MKLNSLIVTLIVLAALSVTAYFLTRQTPAPPADARVGQPLLTTDSVKAAEQLRLIEGSETVMLKKQADGTWQVASYYDFPANFSKIAALIRNLTNAKIQRFVTAKKERFSRLNFNDTSIALLDTNGKSLWSLTLGKTADSGGRFVHFDDETKAYLVKLNPRLDPQSKNWTNSTLLNLEADDIAKVELTFPDADPVIAQRTKPADPFKAAHAPEGQQLKTAIVTTLLRNLGQLHFTDSTALDDPEATAAVAAHQRTVTLTTFTGATYSMSLGRKPESKKLKTPGPATNGIPATKTAKSKEPAKPEYETVPAGPVFVHITSSDANATVNTLMKKRAFKISDYPFTSLPAKRDALYEPLSPVNKPPIESTAPKPESAPTS